MYIESWNRCWEAIKAEGNGKELMLRLLDAYSEPQRKYHTKQHLKECLTLFQENIASPVEPAEIEIALWFHDAIYNVTSADNEEQSANWAQKELHQACVKPATVQRVQELILATKHITQPEDDDQKLLLDIDISILGAQSARFEEYERQVRQEYSSVPRSLYLQKRRQILKSFILRPFIYSTSVFRLQFEEAARENITRALTALN